MEKHFKKLSGFIVILLLLACSCAQKEENRLSEQPEEEIKSFTFKQFAENKAGFILEGESAEISSGDASMKTPQLSFSTDKESIEVITGQEGAGKITMDPDENKVNTIIITGNIKIIYRDIITKEITMEGSCKKLTYSEANKTITMEISPVIKRGDNYFSGDIIYYNLVTNSLDIKGNVNAQIYTEKSAN